MKKIYSLFCAMAIAFSASAAPIATMDQLTKKAPVAVEHMQKVQVANFNQLSAAQELEVTNPMPQAKMEAAQIAIVSEQSQSRLGARTLQMKSNEMQSLQYDATNADFSAAFSNNDAKITIAGTTATVMATDANLKTLSLEMYVASGSTQIPAGDYTITDTKAVGTALASKGVSGSSVTASFAGNRNTQGQITTPIWFLVEGNVNVAYNGYIMTMTIAAKNSNGKEINITVTKDYTPITVRDTVDIVSTALKYNDSYLASNNLVIYFANNFDGYSIFRVTSNNATSVDGTFKWSEDGINSPNSYFIVSGSSTPLYFQDGEFTVTTQDKDIALVGWMIGEDEKYYRLNMSYTAPTVRDTLRFSGQGVAISECAPTGRQTGWIYEVTDAGKGYRFLLQSTVVANKYGTFSYEDKTLGSNYYNVYTTGGNQQFTEGSITVGEVGDSIILNGELIAQDEKVYVLHFAQPLSVLNYDTDAPFDATFAYSDMDASIKDGVISIFATNADNLTIGLELYADPAATTIPKGTYTISDSKEEGTALQSVGVVRGSLTECYAGVIGESGISDMWFMIEGTITLSYDENEKLKVEVAAKNSYEQPVTALIKYEKINPKSVVDINDAEFSVYEGFMEQYGVMNFYGENDDYYFDLYAYADTIVGEFTKTTDFRSCYIKTSDGNVSIIDAYSFQVVGEGKALTLTASLLGADTIQYNISATGYYGYIQGDAKKGYDGEYAREDVTFTQATKTQVMMSASNEVGDTLTIVFEAKFSTTTGAVVEPQVGEYTAIMASTGFYADNTIIPSFIGNAAAVWFIQSGKLTIAADGSITFEGLNSYDATVTVTIPAAATALEKVDGSQCTMHSDKFFHNGQLIIRKENKAFNALGAEVK